MGLLIQPIWNKKKKKRRENLANRIIFAVLKMNRMKTKIFVKVSVIIWRTLEWIGLES